MKRIAVAGLVLAGSLLATPTAFAQTPTPVPTPSCAAALGELTDAQTADAKARQDDRIAADAAKAVTDAEKAHSDLAGARAELAAAVKADNATVPPLTADSQRTKDAKAAVAKLEAEVAKLQDLGVLRAAAAGDKANADKTDAAKTGTALVAARTAANKACETQAPTTTPQPTPTTTPTTTTAPATTPAPVANTNTNSGFEQVGSVPVGGVETGGGPA